MTKGVDGETLDGMSSGRIEKIINSIKDHSYQPKPARRIYIAKKTARKNDLLAFPLGTVSIARAIIKNPEILFCDEATGALYEENSRNVVSYLKEINVKYGTTLVFSTHNIKISKMADRIITMKDGMLVSNLSNTMPTHVCDIDWGI